MCVFLDDHQDDDMLLCSLSLCLNPGSAAAKWVHLHEWERRDWLSPTKHGGQLVLEAGPGSFISTVCLLVLLQL